MNINDMVIEYSTSGDIAHIITLLKENNLPITDIEQGKQNFFVAKIDDLIIGSVGLEIYGSNGLFRSLAVNEKYRNNAIGKRLYNTMLDYCNEKRLNKLYLLTTTASEYFKGLGWNIADRNNVPVSVASSKEFSSLCPSTAFCMDYSLLSV